MRRSIEWIEKATQGKQIDRSWIQVTGVSTDTRTLVTGQLYIPLIGEKFDGHEFYQEAVRKGAAGMLWQSDHPIPQESSLPLVLVEDTLQALQRLATTYRKELSCQIVAVTGSNGKTTTKDLIAAVLQNRYVVQKTIGNLNNHIGLPLTLLSLKEETEVAVVELGMNHAGEIALLSKIAQPDIAVITNIGEAHIEFFGDRAGIAAAKLEVHEGLSEQGVLFYDGDEPLLCEALRKSSFQKRAITWEQVDEVEHQGFAGWSFTLLESKVTYHLSLLGKHNIKNAIIAIRIGEYYGCNPVQIQEGLAQIRGTEMRLNVQEANNGMKMIDDTYNANPTSVRAALELLHEMDGYEKWVLLGDISEIGDKEEIYHRELGELAAELQLSRIYTIGEKARWIHEAAKQSVTQTEVLIEHFSSVSRVVQVLQKEGDDRILLLVKGSRAASLDQVVTQLVEGV